MVKGIEHVGIFGKDTKALADWYCETFDFEIVYDNGKGTYFVAAPDKSMIEICVGDTEPRSTTPTESGIRHIALTTDNLEEMAEKLIASGVEVVTPVKISPNGVGTFFFRDPEGNILHFIQRPSPLV
ncbi:MAG: VOC family protein [Clostridia bacterium]|nr:VOC family protein [Clostridia bacterium]